MHRVHRFRFPDGLPRELVSHVGDFLECQDRRSCILACKGLAAVMDNYTAHDIKFNAGNLHEKLAHLGKIVKCIRSVKVRLKTVKLIFVDSMQPRGPDAPPPLPVIDPDIFEGIDVEVVFASLRRDVLRSLQRIPITAATYYVHGTIPESEITLENLMILKASAVYLDVEQKCLHLMKLLETPEFLKRVKRLVIH